MNNDEIRHNTKNFYNDISTKFSQTRSRFWPGFDFIRKYHKGEGKVLDFGCGNGRLIDYFKEGLDEKKIQENYIGVDISGELIKIARQQYSDYEFKIITDERKLPFKDRQFDFIFSIAVFHHFNPKMAETSLAEFNRVLKPGGIIILSVWYLWRWQYLRYVPWYVPRYIFSTQADLPFKDNDGKTYWRYCYFWTQRGLKRLAKSQGFDILESGLTFDKIGRKRNIYLVLKAT